MKIIYDLNNQLEHSIQDPCFLLTNKVGGFAWINLSSCKSKYQGVFFKENNRTFRVIESITDFKPDTIKNKFWQVEKSSQNSNASFFMPDSINSFVYESSAPSDIILDFKEAYSQENSDYEIESSPGLIQVKIKYDDEIYYLSINFSGNYILKKSYENHFYEYDKDRKSFPCERNVFVLATIDSRKIVFSLSSDKKNSLKLARSVFDNTEKLKKEKSSRILNLVKKPTKELEFAYNSCLLSLDSLVANKRLYAGLPWFFQPWARDELISLKSLSEIDKKIAKHIIKLWFNKLEDFKLPSKDYEESVASIDAVGWLFKRIQDIYPKLLKTIKARKFFENLNASLEENGPKETWMDSLARKGFNIEIQAMKLFMLNLAYKTTNNPKFKVSEDSLRVEVKKMFFENKMLYDNADKKEITPNIFIAYYFYPQLLSKEEWEICFENSLEELWLDWGGLSTISRLSPDFHMDYSGEFGSSYHQGDSWFWINNLVALCLQDLNKEKFSQYIDKIIEASTKEILYLGTLANHAELTSASSLKSEGSTSQSFSAAMYIELIDKLDS